MRSKISGIIFQFGLDQPNLTIVDNSEDFLSKSYQKSNSTIGKHYYDKRMLDLAILAMIQISLANFLLI